MKDGKELKYWQGGHRAVGLLLRHANWEEQSSVHSVAVQCTVGKCAVRCVQCALYSEYSEVYSVQCTVCSVHCTL